MRREYMSYGDSVVKQISTTTGISDMTREFIRRLGVNIPQPVRRRPD
jgi:hypothetical protein